MASHALKVDSTTIAKISEILEKDPTASEALKTSLSEAVNKLWHTTCVGEATLLIQEDCCLTVKPKSEYKKYLKELTGRSGPYYATKHSKSWIGLSEGVYTLEDCDVLIPVSCFKSAKKRSNEGNFLTVFGLVLLSLFQSGAMLLFLL